MVDAGIGRRLDGRGRLRAQLDCRYIYSASTAEFFGYGRFSLLLGLGGLVEF